MKKVLLFCAALCFGVTSLVAQDKFFEGNIGLTYNDASENVVFSVNPNFGFMVNDKWAMGVGVYGGYMDGYLNAYYSEEKLEVTEFGGVLFAQNFTKISDRFYYTPRIYFQFGGGNIESGSISFYGLSFGASIANFEFRAAPKIGVTLDLGGLAFNYSKVKDADEGTFDLKLDAFQTSNIGMRFYF